MFPKAHAVAYVTMAFRIAYFKINYPLAFTLVFSAYAPKILKPKPYWLVMNRSISELEKLNGREWEPPKRQEAFTHTGSGLGNVSRGFRFYPVDIYHSLAHKFTILNDGLLPFSALPNVGWQLLKE